jgi:hypothetical protein
MIDTVEGVLQSTIQASKLQGVYRVFEYDRTLMSHQNPVSVQLWLTRNIAAPALNRRNRLTLRNRTVSDASSSVPKLLPYST